MHALSIIAPKLWYHFWSPLFCSFCSSPSPKHSPFLFSFPAPLMSSWCWGGGLAGGSGTPSVEQLWLLPEDVWELGKIARHDFLLYAERFSPSTWKRTWEVVKRYRVVSPETKAFAQLGGNWTVSASSDELRQFHYPQLAVNQQVLCSETGIRYLLCHSLKSGALGQRNDFSAVVGMESQQ